METKVQIFSHPNFGNMRILSNEGNDPFFVGNDAAQMLGYKVPKDAVSAHCKGAVKCRLPTSGGMQEMKIIPESDFYRLVLKSDMPYAEKVQDWVCEEVLPSIRKTGGYILTKEDDTDDDILSRALVIAQNKIKEREQRIALLEDQNRLNEEQIYLATPKVQYFDNVLQSTSTYTSTQIAKELGYRSALQFHADMKKRSVMFCQSGQWVLTAKYCGKQYTAPRTCTYLNHKTSQYETNTITVWTEKGREFLHRFIKHN